jgi:1,4-alpha-glucan branching enzyme
VAAVDPAWRPNQTDNLAPLGDGSWGGFPPGVGDGDSYMFLVEGNGSTGWKRDSFARELTLTPAKDDPTLRDLLRCVTDLVGLRRS